MRKYRLVAKTGEGTFSEVLKAQNVKDGKYHAIKCMKNRFDSIDQVNNLREIQALRRLSPHDHVVMLEEVLYDQPTGRLALVFELMDANLYEIIKGRRQYLNPQLLKSYMWQLMKSLDHMHKKGIFHRDIKPENILVRKTGDGSNAIESLKLADFGSCRGIYSKQPYTEYISTRWYRAPECLLTDGYYGPEMDLWGAGCVMFEILSLYPLFPGSNEVDQINRIHKILGTAPAEVMQKLKSKGASHISFDFPEQKGVGIPTLLSHCTPESIDLIVKMLKYDASDRISAKEAIRHPHFKEMKEQDAKRTQQSELSGSSVVQSSAINSNIQATVNNSSTHQQQPQVSLQQLQQPQKIVVGKQNMNVPNNLAQSSIENIGNISNNSSGNYQSGSYHIDNSGLKQVIKPVVKSSIAPSVNPSLNQNSQVNSINIGGNSNSNSNNNSSLPPILGHGNFTSGTAQSNNSSMGSSQNLIATKTKKKKYRILYGQRAGQNTEQVMKAYGVVGGHPTPQMNAGSSGLKPQSLNI